MLLPAITGLGVPLLVTAKSHSGVTLVTTVVLLFAALGSPVVAEIDEFAVMVATTTDGATFTTTMMSADAPAARVGSVQVTEAVMTQVQPTGAETETNVGLAGIAPGEVTVEGCRGALLLIVFVAVVCV